MSIPHSLTYSATAEAIAALRIRLLAGQDIARMSESEIIGVLVEAGIQPSQIDRHPLELRNEALIYEFLTPRRVH